MSKEKVEKQKKVRNRDDEALYKYNNSENNDEHL